MIVYCNISRIIPRDTRKATHARARTYVRAYVRADVRVHARTRAYMQTDIARGAIRCDVVRYVGARDDAFCDH